MDLMVGRRRCVPLRRRNLNRPFILLQIRFDAGDDAFELDQLPPRKRRRVTHHQGGQLPPQSAFTIHQPDRFAKLLIGDVRLEALLQVFLELAHFPRPMFQRVGVIGFLGQFEHVHRLRGAHQLEHLLLPVAGRLGDHQVRPFQKWIRAFDVIAEGGFDQRAQIGRQILFRCGDGFRGAAAQADRHGAGGEDDFARCELAQDSHDRPAMRLGGFGVIVAVVNHAGKPGQRFRQSFGARGG